MSPFLILVVSYIAGMAFVPLAEKIPLKYITVLLVVALAWLIGRSVGADPSEYAGADTTRELIYILAFWIGNLAWKGSDPT